MSVIDYAECFCLRYLDFYKNLIVLHFKPIAEIFKNLIVCGVTV